MVTLPTTTEDPTPPSQSGLKPESLSHIDITKLSQSELHALSLCSDYALDLRLSNDVVIPKLNPSFNASRRQTFSLQRHHHHCATLRRHLPNPKPLIPPLSPDPEHPENQTIVHFLKSLMDGGKIDNPPPPQPVVQRDDMQMAVHSAPRKRKRGEGKPSDNPPVGTVPKYPIRDCE